MSKRVIYSIILLLLAIGTLVILRGPVGGLVATILIVAMLLLWVFPSSILGPKAGSTDPTLPRALLIFLGIGVGLAAAAAAAYFLPPELFSIILIIGGIILTILFVFRLFKK